MIKLIASDLDGTLLPEHGQNLSDRTLDLIHQITEKGIHFVSASGRQYDNQRRVFEKIKDEISYIAENGSICIHDGEVVDRTSIAPSLCKRIMEEIKTDGRFEAVISCDRTCYIEDRDKDYVHLVTGIMKNTTDIIDDIRNITEPILKIAICNMRYDGDVFMAYLKHLKELFKDEIKIVTSGNVWIDFIAPGSNKGTALQALMKKFDVKPEECMAFGDQYNDIEMLKLVKYSYTMTHCAPGVEKYSVYQTEHVEDVLEELLSKL